MEDKDIAECYMIMGGIPYYLKNLRHGASLYQNIDEMFFKKRGRLEDEFESLYVSLFGSSENYIKVVEVLSSKKKGLTRDEILEATKLESSGHFTAILKDLIDCDKWGRCTLYKSLTLDEDFIGALKGCLKSLVDYRKKIWDSQE